MCLSCTKNPDEAAVVKECNLHGYAQKGQFVKGSQVTAFAVNGELVATGESFPSSISDDLGSFGVSGKTSAPFIELRAEGYYFNELEGAISSNPLYLEAFVKSDDSAANINLMTTAIRPRVKKLIKEGKTFDEAVNQAQNELLRAIGFTGSSANFDDMDITGTSDGDGMLLAFACLIQCGRSASEVTTFVQEIASDIEDDGELGATVFDKFKSKVADVNPFRVIENLATYYKEKKLAVTNVPAFYRFLDKKYDVPFMIVEDNTIPFTTDSGLPGTKAHESPDQIESGLNVLASINFTVEVDIEGATVNKEQILGPAYYISFTIPANESTNGRTAHIVFKDASGNILDQRELVQGGSGQYLIIQYGNATKASVSSFDNPFQLGTEISVNGEAHAIERIDAYGGQLGVKVSNAESYLVTYPMGKVFSSGHIARVSTTVSEDQTIEPEMYFYGGLAEYNGIEISNPGYVRMQPCLPAIMIKFDLSNVSGGYSLRISDVEISPVAQNEYLAGTASFVVNEQDKTMYPGLNPNIAFATSKHSIKLGLNSDNKSYGVTFPQTLTEGLIVSFKHTLSYSGSDVAVEVLGIQIPQLTQLRAGCLYGIRIKVNTSSASYELEVSDYYSSGGTNISID